MMQLIGILFIGGLYYLGILSGRESAFREIEQQKQKDDIEMLKDRWRR